MFQKSSGLFVTTATLTLPPPPEESRLHDGRRARAQAAADRKRVRRENDMGESRVGNGEFPTR
jgi:hypothetical protein